MNLADVSTRLFLKLNLHEVLTIKSFFAVIDPSVKLFINTVAIVGPTTIIGLILILKKIEKKEPDKIRWR